MGISRWLVRGARRAPALVALGIALGLAACGGRPQGVLDEPAAPPAPKELKPEEAYLVEVWGPSPPDTTVAFLSSQPRTIVLRHGPPDNTVFAEVSLPANALAPAAGGDSVRLQIRPLPGIYGVDLIAEGKLAEGARLTFKYPVHFAAPAASRDKYPTELEFERALVIARQPEPGAPYHTLPITRPASDNLSTELPELGRYLLVAPR
ncbi:MAG TPA: hypothetical protein VFO06_01545 [Gemmatimonadales bacterium]|nr:hypothetical protein [Gemmatimonadales bacterium]